MIKRCTKGQLCRGAVFWHVNEITGTVAKFRVVEPFEKLVFLGMRGMLIQEIKGNPVNPVFVKQHVRYVDNTIISAFTTERRARAYARVVEGRNATRPPVLPWDTECDSLDTHFDGMEVHSVSIVERDNITFCNGKHSNLAGYL